MSQLGDMDSNVRFEQLLTAARQGSRQSLGSALEICRQYLLLVANQALDEQLQAKGGGSDLVQDTFFEAQRDFAKFTGSTRDEMLAWLRRILLNNVANFRRFHLETGKRNAGLERSIQDDPSASNPGVEIPSPQQSPSQCAINQERMAALDHALSRLSAEQQQVIRLKNQQHLSFEAIGATIGKTSEAVRKLWARAVERLQQELGPSDDSS